VNGCVKRFGSFTKLSLYGVLTFLTFASSQAGPLTFQGSSGSKVSSATFAQNGSQLIVTVANTSTADVLKPVDILTALFFSLAGNPSMTPVSAMVPNGSSVYFGPSNGGNVGGEWAYRNYMQRRPPFGANQGISTASAGGFGKKNLFPGPNLQGPLGPSGIRYGLTSKGDNVNTGTKPVTGRNALILNELVFTFDLPGSYSLDSYGDQAISSISFQYGANLSKKSNVPAYLIPEPSTWVLVGGSVLLLLQFRRRKA
jgi:hypothetical protein